MAAGNDQKNAFMALADCKHFINGPCPFKNKCHFRHSQAAVNQPENCPNWPASCRDVNCPFRHIHPKSEPAGPKPARRQGLVVFFWDIENVAIPKGQRPFDIVQRIRQKFATDRGLQEIEFSCYCNINTISVENQQSLQRATVRLNHVPDRKANAADREIMLNLNRFERNHKPPATIVLISGDTDFVGALSDLRHQAGYDVVVIHNKAVASELKATVNEHYPWTFFTGTAPDPTPVVPEPLPVPMPKVGPVKPLPRAVSGVINKTKIGPSSGSEPNIQLAENDSTEKSPTMYECPHCTNEFNTTQKLRQHQKDKKHLYDCSECSEGFVTDTALKQHQTAKRHALADIENV